MHAGPGGRQANVQFVMTDWGADTRIEYGPNSTNSSSPNRASIEGEDSAPKCR
jgi:hypothetical protein